MRNALSIGIASIGIAGLAVACDEIKVVPGDPVVNVCDTTVDIVGDPGIQNVTEGKELSLTFSANASDGGTIEWEVAQQPTGATINSESGVFVYTPAFSVSSTTANASFNMKVLAKTHPSGCNIVTQELTVVINVLDDLDEDGTANATDDDADGDGVSKADELSQNLNDLDADFDDDGHEDGDDNCPGTANATQDDLDGDDLGNQCDQCPNDPANDSDQDGVCDSDDNCPTQRNVPEDCDNNTVTPMEQCDADGDGLGEVLSVASGTGCDDCPNDPDNDLDGDKACAHRNGEAYDNCPDDANPKDCDGNVVIDTDGNITGAGQCDSDDDGFGDGFGPDGAGCDPCPNDHDNDADEDGACNNGDDNCPDIKNDDQSDIDHDDIGDACDPDIDGDDVPNDDDNCPNAANAPVGGVQADNDGDGDGDACDDDDDNDDHLDVDDNCQFVENANQLDPDGDDIGFQCDSLEEVPFAVHQGEAIVRIDGDAKGGTLALSLRGQNPCVGAACVRPGAYVVNAADEDLQHHFTQGDAATAWLDLVPPGSDLLPPHVTQAGEALFASDGVAGPKLWRADPVTNTVTAAFANPIFAPPLFFDAPDGATLIQTKLTSAAQPPALFKLEVAGQPQQVRSANEFVDSNVPPVGPLQLADDTLYIPVKSSGTYTLVAYTAAGTSQVPTVKIGAPTVSVQSANDLRFVRPDRVSGSPWYCWQSTDTPSRTSYFQIVNGTIVHHRKTSFAVPCAQVTAQQATNGTWFFVGPGTTAGQFRVSYWQPDGDTDASNDTLNPFGDLFGTSVAATFSFHFTNAHTFIQRDNGDGAATQDDDGANQFYWFNPSAPGTPVELGATPLFAPQVDVDEESNWFGVSGRTDTLFYASGNLVARRFQGGVSATAEERIVLTALDQFWAAANVWIGPSGTMFVEYAAPENRLQIVPKTLPVPASPLTPVAAGKVNVTFHGSTTLVSYVTATGTGLITTPNETGTTAKLDSLGITVRGVHEDFQHDALRAGMADNFVSYLDGSPPSGKFVVARIGTAGGVSLTPVLSGLTTPPQAAMLGPNNEVWFAYENASGFGYASVSATAFTDFVSGMESVEPMVKDLVGSDDDALWGILVRRDAASEHYACRLPVTTGLTTSAANCWQASEANATVLWKMVDERNVSYVVSVSGSPAAVSIFQSVTEVPLAPADIPE